MPIPNLIKRKFFFESRLDGKIYVSQYSQKAFKLIYNNKKTFY